MLFTILAIVIALVAWSLHLMHQAVERQEFSLMLAGTLVAFSAAAMMTAYYLMGNCMGYLTKTAQVSYEHMPLESVNWTYPFSDEPTSYSMLQTAARFDRP